MVSGCLGGGAGDRAGMNDDGTMAMTMMTMMATHILQNYDEDD